MTSRKKRLCVIADYAPWSGGGVECVVRQTVRFAIEAGYCVSVVFRERSETADGFDEVRFVRVPDVKLPFLHHVIYSLLAGARAMVLDCDIVHVHAQTGFGFVLLNRITGVWKKKRPFLVATYHGTARYIMTYNFGLPIRILVKLALMMFSYMHRKVAHAADVVIAVSDIVRDEIVADYHVDPCKVVVVRNGVDTEAFQPHPKCEARRLLELDADALVLLFVGKNLTVKGFDTAYTVAKKLRKIRENTVLVVVGPKRIPQGCNDVAVKVYSGLPRRLLPYVYSAADVLLHPSRYEGGHPTLTILESLACGTPVVVSWEARVEEECPGIVTVRDRDPEAWCEAVLALIALTGTSDLSKQCREFVTNKYGIELYRQYIEIYQSGTKVPNGSYSN